jgi:hypothetical protein
VNDTAESNLHSNVAPPGPVNEKLALVDADGLGGINVITGAANGEAANAANAKYPAAASTPSRTATKAALLAVLRRPLKGFIAIRKESPADRP